VKKRILIFIFLVITVGGIGFTAFTAYRVSTITDLAIKHSAQTIRDVYFYSKDKKEAINIIKSMPNIEDVEVISKTKLHKMHFRKENVICMPLNTDKELRIIFKSIAEFENEKYQVILETVIINILFILFSNLLLNWLITPYLNIFEEFRESFEKATKGDFSKKITTTLKNEVKNVVDSYNLFISQIDKNFELIEENLKILVPNAPISENRIVDIDKNMQILGDINRFKKIIEEDSTTAEIYNRIINILEEKFNVENFKIYEILNEKNKIKLIYQKGKNCCDISMPRMCRAYKTSHEVDSKKFPHICQEHFCENYEYICIPFSTGGTFTGVVSINFTKEEWENHYKNNMAYIESYLQETAPIIEAKYTLNLMKENSLTDQLTGLYNRRYLEEILDKISASAVRENSLLGILMLDVDYFKKVNDTYGHDAGDKVLVELARTMVNSVRESDFVVRFGGEEFIIILQNVKDEKGILKVAEKIRESFANTKININGKTLTKTVSIGVAVFPIDTDKIWEAIKCADLALYEAKETGRNKVVRFRTELMDKANYEGDK